METPSIKHRWRWTRYPGGYRQYLLYISSGYLLFTSDFWHKIWNFLRTKMPLGFTIHAERHQFYWDRRTMASLSVFLINSFTYTEKKDSRNMNQVCMINSFRSSCLSFSTTVSYLKFQTWATLSRLTNFRWFKMQYPK